MVIPKSVADRIAATFGDVGTEWLERLPRLIAEFHEEWQLVPVSAPFASASINFVAPVTGPAGADLVLKIAIKPAWVEHEIKALTHWAGRGTVRLVHADVSRGALLLERAMPGEPLSTLAASDDDLAVSVACDVIARLRQAAPAPSDWPTVETWLGDLTRETLPHAPTALRAMCRDATAIASDLLRDCNKGVALHGDLHHGNVLSVQEQQWIAIDPKGLTGPREIETAALLRNPRRHVLEHPNPVNLMRRRVSLIAERLGDDAARVTHWGFVFAVCAAMWALEDGNSQEDVAKWLQCAHALRAAIDAS